MPIMEKCICNECPVQAKSECAQQRFKKTPELIEKGKMPDPKEFPGLYCATSTTPCDDLNYDEMCNCVNCPIYEEEDLGEGEPGSYYCKNR
jgi:hypothetical protein